MSTPPARSLAPARSHSFRPLSPSSGMDQGNGRRTFGLAASRRLYPAGRSTTERPARCGGSIAIAIDRRDVPAAKPERKLATYSVIADFAVRRRLLMVRPYRCPLPCWYDARGSPTCGCRSRRPQVLKQSDFAASVENNAPAWCCAGQSPRSDSPAIPLNSGCIPFQIASSFSSRVMLSLAPFRMRWWRHASCLAVRSQQAVEPAFAAANPDRERRAADVAGPFG